MINIENKTKNPITEHKVDILNRLNPNMIIGRGMIKINKYIYIKIKRTLKILRTKLKI
jgi:hypothetical protein